MSYSNRGAAAIAEMGPYGRPPVGQQIPSGWQRPSYPMSSIAGEHGNLTSGWQRPSYPLSIGFDPGTFLSENKIAVAIAAAVIAGSAAYYFGYR